MITLFGYKSKGRRWDKSFHFIFTERADSAAWVEAMLFSSWAGKDVIGMLYE